MMNRSTGKILLSAKGGLIILAIVSAVGCRSRVEVHPPPGSRPEESTRLLGFVIQVGAFAVETNAEKLTQSLMDRGYDAYAFVHESGLYKVRLGNYSSLAEARSTAKTLLSQRVIEDFFIIRPKNYAAYKTGGEASYSIRGSLVSTARRFIGKPYCWGGASPDEGFDCSGLAMAVYRLNGFNLPRSSREQFKAGRPVSSENLKKGDLLFFATNGNREVSHVGIYIGSRRFIHAPKSKSRVREDSLSNKYFQSRFIGARTYLPHSK